VKRKNIFVSTLRSGVQDTQESQDAFLIPAPVRGPATCILENQINTAKLFDAYAPRSLV